MQRGPQDDHRSQHVQDGLADIGNGTPCVRVPQARGEPGDRDAPAAGNEGQQNSIERDTAARSPVRVGARSLRWLCRFSQTDGAAGVNVESADHLRCGNLEGWRR